MARRRSSCSMFTSTLLVLDAYDPVGCRSRPAEEDGRGRDVEDKRSWGVRVGLCSTRSVRDFSTFSLTYPAEAPSSSCYNPNAAVSVGRYQSTNILWYQCTPPPSHGVKLSTARGHRQSHCISWNAYLSNLFRRTAVNSIGLTEINL
ncbi:hypothetical protein H4582DRAFT_680925 [Lactarius indigo]|nr:hypothetical protein H4582DRAFT_680925 [Lactarius indigo]